MLVIKYLNPKIKKTPAKKSRMALIDEWGEMWEAKQVMKFREKQKQAK